MGNVKPANSFVARDAIRSVVRAEQDQMLRSVIGPGVAQGVAAIIRELEARIIKLEAAQAEFRYLGNWEAGKQYAAGNFVTFAGGIWHADRPTTSRPGGPDSDFTLAVAKARDGKDAPTPEHPLEPEQRRTTKSHR